MTVYKITFRKRASQEYIKTIAWYQQHSLQAAENFVEVIQVALTSISGFLYSYKNSYKHFYEVKTKKIPFTIVYLIDEKKVYYYYFNIP